MQRSLLPRSSLRFLLLLVLALAAGCAGRPGPDLLDTPATVAPDARTVSVYVASTRQRDEANARAFTSGRAEEVGYAEYTISIPPHHKPGNIEWPDRHVDPATDFAVVGYRELKREAFAREVSRPRNGSPPDVGVFVHGFNTNFQEALFRLAQMTADADIEGGSPILFAWPSEGQVRGYISDKDAATYSRDQLVGLLTTLAGMKTRSDITVIGHSMGGWLTAEAIRQLRLTGRNAVIDRLQVILAAPDIDVDVFRAQTAVIGPLSPPMTILVSRDDLALRVSEFLTGERPRVGKLDVNDPRVEEATLKAGVQVVDISELEAPDDFKHGRFAQLATLYPKLAGTNQPGPGLRQAGAFVFNAVGATLSSPFVLAGKVVGGQ
ncbi:alpha/beta hydrolase [Pleomorphomonas carboxyditropha]|uniref:alpha/beta hydrolase n=1 Tax=Pleomorphomonas carboxyditropha TaxID=2023338 RepID=UPI001FDECCE4|nr:alpha/beta fold hydrolase [Pleomorphomonas carboxyditropha]